MRTVSLIAILALIALASAESVFKQGQKRPLILQNAGEGTTDAGAVTTGVATSAAPTSNASGNNTKAQDTAAESGSGTLVVVIVVVLLLVAGVAGFLYWRQRQAAQGEFQKA